MDRKHGSLACIAYVHGLYNSFPKYPISVDVDVRMCGRVEALDTYIKAYLGTEVALDDLKGMLCFDKRKQCFRWLQDQVTLN